MYENHLSPSVVPYITRFNYDYTNTSSVQLVCGVGTPTIINAYGGLFTLEQTDAQTIGGVNTAAVSDLQPSITASAVTATQSPSPVTSTSPAPAATSSKAASSDGGGGLAVGSEIGSIVGGICGAIALGVSVYFGWKGLEKSREKKVVARKEEEEKAALEEPMIAPSGREGPVRASSGQEEALIASLRVTT